MSFNLKKWWLEKFCKECTAPDRNEKQICDNCRSYEDAEQAVKACINYYEVHMRYLENLVDDKK